MKQLALLLLLPMALWAAAQQPQFGLDADSYAPAYHIVFTCCDGALKDDGAGKNTFSTTLRYQDDYQLWTLVGSPEAFTARSHKGNWLTMPAGLLQAGTQDQAATLRLHALDDGSYEIELVGTDSPANRLTLQGAAMRSFIGLGASGSSMCNVRFYTVNQISPDHPLPSTEFAVSPIADFAPAKPLTLWYKAPVTAKNVADPWMEYALPVGNGRLGAMAYGGVLCDRLQFNDKTLWTGSPTLRGSYQNFGELRLLDHSDTFGTDTDHAITGYLRSLDLTDGIAATQYASTDGTVSFSRQYLASYPHQVIAMHITASKPGALSLCLQLVPGIKPQINGPQYSATGTMSFGGKLDYITYRASALAVPTGGSMSADADGLHIDHADDLVIYLAATTDFDPHSPDYLDHSADLAGLLEGRLQAAADAGWDAVLAEHIADHSALMQRSQLVIDRARNLRPTDELVAYYSRTRPKATPHDDPEALMLEQLYYAMGRYLLIGSSRGIDSPANLQGIWNHSNKPAWQCDIHSNINVQMNYWPAETTGLSELHIPFLNYIALMATEHTQWQDYARRSGQTKGWTCFTQNNIFGHSDFAENYVIANAWYATHLWDHYRYTLDADYLADTALAPMVAASEFWLERLVEDSDGTLVAPDEWSPEHGPAAENGTAHAQQLVRALFEATLEALDICAGHPLATDALRAELTDKLSRLDNGLDTELYTGTWGETHNGIATGDALIREWKYTAYDAGEQEHRHQSHLMALFPLDQIGPESPWFEPAVNSLRMRGDVSTGWSLAWRTCLWARALDGQHAHDLLRNALRHAISYGESRNAGGIYYNLLDSHAPFQIDGNMGMTAAIAQMLLQYSHGTIYLLPALPDLWPDGHILGLCAPGAVTIDQYWTEGQLASAVITTRLTQECTLAYPGIDGATLVDTDGNEVPLVHQANAISFTALEGVKYTLTTAHGMGAADACAPSLRIVVDNGVARLQGAASAHLCAYDLCGRLLARTTGTTLPLDMEPGTPLIIKATAPDGRTATAKAFCH